MLRMAHRIALQGLELPDFASRSIGDALLFARGVRDESRLAIANSPTIIADNVSAYYEANARDSFSWDLSEDCPCLAPVTPSVFVEHGITAEWKKELLQHAFPNQLQRVGTLFVWETAANAAALCDRFRAPRGMTDRKFSDDAEWFCFVIQTQQHAFEGRIPVVCVPSIMSLWLNKYGVLTELNICGIVDGDQEEAKLDFIGSVYPAMLAVSFMNCKNVARRDVTDAEGPGEKWIRRQKAPTIRYHILDINPMKEVLRAEGGIEHNGIKKALHICRGHFATYTAEKPLFGNFVGTVWKPAHVRGDIKQGAVVKDYSVTPNP